MFIYVDRSRNKFPEQSRKISYLGVDAGIFENCRSLYSLRRRCLGGSDSCRWCCGQLQTLCDIVLYSVYVCVVGVDSVAVVFRTGFAVVCERWTCVPRVGG